MLQRDLLANEIRTHGLEAARLTTWVNVTVARRDAAALLASSFVNDGAGGRTNTGLALGWGVDTPADALRMLTARMAELAALDYFRLDQPVDISLTQARKDPKLSDWMTHDIFLEREGVPVDVKSARRPNWVPARAQGALPYREFLVPQFKRERELQEHVRIAGVLSPHLDAADFGYHGEEPADEWYPHRDYYPGRNYREIPKYFTILGTTSLPEIRALEERFTRGDFQVEIVATHRGGAMLPPWLFTHHPRVLHKLNGAIRAFVHACERYPADEPLPYYPVPRYLAARHPLTPRVAGYLDPWQQQLYQLLLGVEHTLPHVYLALLKHFVWAARRDLPDFEPADYSLLFFGDGGRRPVGIPDPLRLIRGLIDTLQTTWDNREHLNLAAYDTFHYRGMGVLQGTRDNQTWTILAYCRDCAAAPLVAGQERHCDTCRRLACPYCGACGYNCPDGHTRKAAIARRREDRRREREEQIRAQRSPAH